MRKAIVAACTAAVLAIPLGGTAAADPGGEPNPNATTQTGNADPEGRKGTCLVVGAVIYSETAKEAGNNSDPFGGGATPGQAVSFQCTKDPT